MMYLGRICFVFCLSFHAHALMCNVSTQYILKRDSGGKILRCPACRACPAGEEPAPPCGSVVGLYDILRNCKPCKENYYSALKDFRPCQLCRNSKCLTDEIKVGSCEITKPDTSYCTGHCKRGYVMNNNKSACVLEELLKPRATRDSGLSVGKLVGKLVGIVSGALLGIAIIIGLIWYYKRRNTNTRVIFHTLSGTSDIKTKEENICCEKPKIKPPMTIIHSQEQSKDEVGCKYYKRCKKDNAVPVNEEEVVMFGKQEEAKLTDNNKPHCSESTGGYKGAKESVLTAKKPHCLESTGGYSDSCDPVSSDRACSRSTTPPNSTVLNTSSSGNMNYIDATKKSVSMKIEVDCNFQY